MKTSGFRCETKFGHLFFLGHPNEDLTLDLKQGTPWTSNHGAGVRCFISAHEKNLPNRFVRQDEELEGGADAGTTPRRIACEILYFHSIQDMKFRKS